MLSGCAVDAASDESPGPEAIASAGGALQSEQTLQNTVRSTPAYTAPAGAGTWTRPPATTADSDPTACRDCSFSLGGTDLGGTAARGHEKNESLETYAQGLRNLGVSKTGQPAGLKSLMLLAGQNRSSVHDASYASDLDDTFNEIAYWLRKWPGVSHDAVQVRQGSSTTWHRSYTPIKTRAKVSEYFTPVWNNANSILHTYNTQPLPLSEARFRGARSYCAMRECAFAQAKYGKTSLGASSLASFLFWDLGASESSVAVGPTQKFTDSNGANAFLIPLVISSNIQPLAGPLVPQLPEVAHPVAWITGDSENVSNEDRGLIRKTGVSYYGYRKNYLNTQHADYFEGKTVHGALKADNLPVMELGFVSISAGFGMTADYGVLLPATIQDDIDGKSVTLSSALDGGRALTDHLPYPVPPARTWTFDVKGSGGYVPSAFASDAPFKVRGDYFTPWEGGPYTPWNIRESSLWGIKTRALHDDDRSISLADRVHQQLSLSATGGFKLGAGSMFYLRATVDGKSSVDIVNARYNTIREHLSAVSRTRMTPTPSSTSVAVGQTNLVVVPETESVLSVDPLNVSLNLHAEFTFDTPFGSITAKSDWSQSLYKSGTSPVAGGRTIGDEASRLRVGEFSDEGSEFDAPRFRSTYSHLPSPGAVTPLSFASFPPGHETVAACLTDPKESTPPPPPDEAGGGTPSDWQPCVYGLMCPGAVSGGGCGDVPGGGDPWQIPAKICDAGQINAWLATKPALTDEKKDCLRDELEWLCSGDHLVQNWGPANVVAHVIQWDDDTREKLHELQQGCLAAFVTSSDQSTADQQLKDTSVQLFQYGFCSPEGQIQGQAP